MENNSDVSNGGVYDTAGDDGLRIRGSNSDGMHKGKLVVAVG